MSKRALYQPAVEEKGQTQHIRKPLAQGRLIQEKPVNSSDNQRPKEAIQQGAEVLLHGDAARLNPPLNTHDEDQTGDTSTPRKSRPQTSFTQSPRAVQPSHFLDISDTDSEVVFNRQPRYLFGARVLGTVSPGAHSRGAVNSSQQRPESPPIRAPPSSRFEHQSPRAPATTNTQEYNSNEPFASEEDRAKAESEIGSWEEAGAGGDREPRPELSGCPRSSQDLLRKTQSTDAAFTIKQVDKDQSTKHQSKSGGKETMNSSSDSSERSNLPVAPGTAEKSAATKPRETGTPLSLKKKKKAPRYVASRYMQTVSAKGDKSVMGASNSSAGSSLNSTSASRRPTPGTSTDALKPKRTGTSVAAPAGKRHMMGASATLQPKRTGPTSSALLSRTSGRLKPKRTAPARSESTSCEDGGLGGGAGVAGSGRASGQAARSASRGRDGMLERLKTTASKTPETRRGVSGSRVGAGGKASTPTTESQVHAPEAVDISAIGPPKAHHTSFSSPTLDDTGLSLCSKAGGGAGGRSRSSRAAPLSSTAYRSILQPFDFSTLSSVQDSAYMCSSKREAPVTQATLDVLHMRYLQWLFLRSSAQRAVNAQQTNFMTEAAALWQETEKLREKETQLKRQLAGLQHTNQLDQALQIQEAGLGGLESHLDEVRNQYGGLAAALDTTRHQIPTSGIHLPDDELHFQERMCEAVSETEQLLEELSLMTSSNASHVTNMAASLHSVHNSAQAQVKELHRCAELLAAADTMATRESSLSIMQMTYAR